MEHELRQAGIEVESIRVDRKGDFIQVVREFQPDIILADYSLSMFNGVQAFQMLKKEKLETPFILVTGVLNEKMALDCLNDGIDDFVLKSSFRRLPHAISNAIAKKETKLEKRRMTAELEKSHLELRLLLNRQQTSIEEERLNIARDLHDELGQVLTALKIDIMMLWKKIGAGKLPSKELADEELGSIVQLVDKITLSVKEISSGLRPETLDELGLVEAIRWHAVEFERRNNIKCILTLPFHSMNLSGCLSIALFRIVQETLTNVARHSKATRVEIKLSEKDGEISLEISDNGVGISDSHVQSSKSLGLIGLRERVHLHNGKLSIHSGKEGGTKVSIVIPQSS